MGLPHQETRMTAPRSIDTGSDHVLASVADRVATITLNRPERRNALGNETLLALEVALDAVDRDDGVRAVVLTGAGGAFCSGGDLKGMDEMNRGEGKGADGPGIDAAIAAQRRNQRNTAGRIYTMPKPVIASIPGAAAGAGVSLALACDLRIASERAFFTTAFARVGFSGDYGGTYFLTHLVGAAKARELYLLSERFDAKEALRLGLVNWVVPTDALEEQTQALAQRLANGPTVAYRYMKENLNRAVGGHVMECLDLEATHHIHTGRTRDHRAAVRAFVEKREPAFEGR
jgi:2-(1,2-epoxy-1,2-dihydrophenyl)acetyl-CoA isomerase